MRRATYGRINDISRLIFLSTLSLRRATRSFGPLLSSICHFYPRSPCGERLLEQFKQITETIFLSTLSLRRATVFIFAGKAPYMISIHALLAESDDCRKGQADCSKNFYPRSPCGERPLSFASCLTALLISIHALLAESDLMWYQCNTVVKISIHALLAESDLPSIATYQVAQISIHALLAESDLRGHFGSIPKLLFLSTLSLRRATKFIRINKFQSSISIHALLAESDLSALRISFTACYFYPRSPCGERLTKTIM